MRPPSMEKQDARWPPWSAEEESSPYGHGASSEGHRRLRWNAINYPRRDCSGNHDKSFGIHEEELIIKLHATIGSRWTIIAQQLPGRTESEVKNCWNTKLKKRLTEMGIDPVTHKPFSQVLRDYDNIGGHMRVVGNRVGSIYHSKDLRNAHLSNSNSKSHQQRRRQQQQQFTPIHFHTHPSQAPAMMMNSPPTPSLSPQKSTAESLGWADFLVGHDAFEASDGQLISQPDDLRGIIMPSGKTVECPLSSSSSSSSAADDLFVETLLNKHTETLMDFPETWDDSIS